MTHCAIGVDIGTTSTKAVAFDARKRKRGDVLAHHAVEYPLETPEPGAAVQDPARIHLAVVAAIRGVVEQVGGMPGDVACVSFSAAMHSVIALDDDGSALTPSITWADNRAAPWARIVNHEHDGLALYRRTGTPIHPMSPLVKLLWLRHAFPTLWKRARRFVGIKEYVLARLCGVYVVDHSIASATGLFNLETRDWDEGALALTGLDPSRLSTLVPTTHRLAFTDAAPALLGLTAMTPVIVGANDGVLSNLGVGAIDRGSVALTIGTSGAMRTVVDTPQTDPDGRTFCYALTDRHWVVGGPVNNGGIVLRWVRDEFAAAETETAKRLGIDPYDVLTHIAARVPAGSAGLLFHPFLAGERAPLWNPDLRGSFFGLAMHHRKEHMIRAVLEGVVMNLHTILPAVEALVGRTHRDQGDRRLRPIADVAPDAGRRLRSRGRRAREHRELVLRRGDARALRARRDRVARRRRVVARRDPSTRAGPGRRRDLREAHADLRVAASPARPRSTPRSRSSSERAARQSCRNQSIAIPVGASGSGSKARSPSSGASPVARSVSNG